MLRLPPGEGIESRYEVGERIGKGAVAEVFHAVCRATGATRALKVVHFGALDDKIRWRSYLEVEILRRVRHPHIVRLHEVLLSGDTCALVLDCLPVSGEKRVVQGRMDEAQARRMAMQLLTAAEYLHANGVVHRDIKPENVMFGDGDDVQLIDFGLCKLLPPANDDESGIACTPCGSARTMAPEVVEALRDGGFDARHLMLTGQEVKSCDVFSIGCVVYIFLCQAPPFRGSNSTQLQQSIARGEASLRQSSRYNRLSEPCKDFLRRCLSREGRPSAASALRHAWLDAAAADAPEPAASPDEYHLRARQKLDEFYRLTTPQEVESYLTRAQSFDDDLCGSGGASDEEGGMEVSPAAARAAAATPLPVSPRPDVSPRPICEPVADGGDEAKERGALPHRAVEMEAAAA